MKLLVYQDLWPRERDPLRRRVVLRAHAVFRVKRRVTALLAYIDAHPEATRDSDDALRRLDDLLGEAERLRKAL